MTDEINRRKEAAESAKKIAEDMLKEIKSDFAGMMPPTSDVSTEDKLRARMVEARKMAYEDLVRAYFRNVTTGLLSRYFDSYDWNLTNANESEIEAAIADVEVQFRDVVELSVAQSSVITDRYFKAEEDFISNLLEDNFYKDKMLSKD